MTLTKENIKDIYTLSPMQEGMFFHWLYDKSSLNYFEQACFRLRRELNVELVEKSLDELVKRYDILRTVFTRKIEEKILQIVLKERKMDFYYEDISKREDKKNYSDRYKEQDKKRRFDLTRDGLTRIALFRWGEADYEFTWSFHHIIMDGWCIGILVSEFYEIYNSFLENRPYKLPRPKPYRVYIDWLERQDRKKSGDYWREYLDGYDEKSGIPGLIPPGAPTGEYKNEKFVFTVNSEKTVKLGLLAAGCNITLNTLFQAIWGILLGRYNNTTDVVFGSVVSGRPAEIEDVESMIGLFINTVPVRIKYEKGMLFNHWLKEVRERDIACTPHHHYPLVEIQNESDLKQNLLDHLVIFENYPFDSFVKDVKFEFLDVEGFDQTNYDFNLTVSARERLTILLDYNGNVYERKFVENIANHLPHIIDQVLNDETREVDTFELLTKKEREEILLKFNDTRVDYPKDKTVHQLFEEQAAASPGKVAVIFGDSHLAYEELNRGANRSARQLRGMGVRTDEPVGILMERSPRMVESILAVWKAGGAYIPLDTRYPPRRILGILKDSGAKVSVSMERYVTSQLVGEYRGRIFDVSAPGSPGEQPNPDLDTDMNSLAYVIYTSGSTGRPKGVMVEHRGMMNHIYAKIGDLRLTGAGVVAQNSSHTFDISVWQFFSSLILGGRLVIYPEELILHPENFASRVAGDRVTILEVVPSYLSLLLDYMGNEKTLPLSLRYLLVTGEEIKPHLVRQWFTRHPAVKMVNAYGPTEASDDITHYIMDKAPEMERIPVGKPLRNLNIYIVDKHMNLSPVGIKGEICVSGVGVGRGYLGDEEKTKQVFMEDPFAGEEGVRMYKTGDLGRWLPDGVIEFFGRKDHQVKIRGFRIELGEIENRLLDYPGVKEAVVINRAESNGDKYLCAYIVSDKEYEPAELGAFLSGELPDYMVPAYFTRLENIPLTSNGKIDRRALPEPEMNNGEGHVVYRNEIEEKLAGIWGQVLGGDSEKTNIRTNDNFFEIGGHSLKATVLVSRIEKAFNVKVLLSEIFRVPTIRGLAELIKASTEIKHSAIKPVEKKEYYPLSSAQKRLFVLRQMDPVSTAYNMSQIAILEGELDIEKLEEIFKKILLRHESLRTSFWMVRDTPFQEIHREVNFGIQLYEVEDEDKIEGVISGFIRPFDLSKSPMLRVGLVKIKKEKHLLMIDMHHIASDGFSLLIAIREFVSFYKGEELPALKLHYKDYSEWQNREEQKQSIERQEKYWLKEFDGAPPVLNLPTDFTRPKVQSFEGRLLFFEIDEEETADLNKLAASEGTTLYMVLLSIFNVLLSKLSGQEDIVIGSPIAGRRHVDLENIIGMFVNTLALLNFPRGERTFRAFLAEVKNRTLEAFENQDYPFEELVDRVLVSRDASRNPIFDVLFVLQNIDMPQVEMPGLKLLPYNFEYNNTKFDLRLQVVESGDKLQCTLEYCTRLFKKESIERMISFFNEAVSSILEDPGKKIMEIEIMSGEEEKRLLFDFNQTPMEYPGDKTIPRLFEELVERPAVAHRVALVGTGNEIRRTDVKLTFTELSEKSNLLSRLFRKKGVESDSAVGIMTHRSVSTIVAMLGVLKAGAGFLPIDPSFPGDRIEYMLTDSNAKLLLDPSGAEHKFKERSIETIDISDLSFLSTSTLNLDSTCRLSPTNLVYIIYTSGTSGRSKGVAITQKNMINYAYWFMGMVDLTREDQAMCTASFAFDAVYTQVFSSLLKGCRFHVIDTETNLSAEKFLNYIRKNRITYLKVTPSLFKIIVSSDYFSPETCQSLRFILIGGEEINVSDVEIGHRRCPHIRFINHYGPTETTIGSSAQYIDFSNFWEYKQRPTIGRPIYNTQVYILGRHLTFLPPGIFGELVIGGDGLGRGYLNRPELTMERFIAHPFKKGERLYRTGDLARLLPDGRIELTGRIDSQVKIRGYRIELGEIENRLLRHENIRDARVLVRQDKKGNKYLCAYVVNREELPVSLLRDHLLRELPDYMVPLYFVPLEEIPLTRHNKVDHSKLPEPAAQVTDTYVPPGSEIEEKLVNVWQEVLGVEKIGITDNFFELGGDSIKAIQVTTRLKNYRLDLKIRDVFSYPIIEKLGKCVKETGTRRIIHQGTVEGEVELTPIQARFFDRGLNEVHHYNQAVMLYREQGFDETLVEKVFTTIAEHHDALRMVYGTAEDKIIQRNRNIEGKLLGLEVVRFAGDDIEGEMEKESNRIQGGIDLEAGPLLKLGLFKTTRGDYLLIVIHHLVIDGVSWRILFEDIETLYLQYESGRSVKLPGKTDSFRRWAENSAQYANSKSFLKEKTYWARLESQEIPGLKRDFEDESNIGDDVEALSFDLDESDTEILLKRVNGAFGTEINDILLTALGLALKKVFGQNRFLVALEGHGREGIPGDMDISRTVGWFTCIYPVVLDISYESDPARQVKEVKESLHRVPNNGIGYGILKYMTAEEHKAEINFKLKPQLIFNYLGQFDVELKQMSSFEIAKESAGNAVSPKNQREYEFDVMGMIVNKKLSISIGYNRKHYQPGTVEALLNEYRVELTRIISFCSTRERREFTPGDFTYKELSMESVHHLTEVYPDVEDIYTLSPMQEGMLFHALYDASSYSYFQQMSYRLHGELDIYHVEKSLNELFKRYDILRTAFVHDIPGRPVQVVSEGRQCDFYYQDLRETDGPGDKEAFVSQFRIMDKRRSFDLGSDVLMRVSILQVGDSECEVIWSFHHILMDGWCVGILHKEFFEIYNSIKENRSAELKEVKPFRDYIVWLEKQDKEASKRYWSRYLSSYEEQSGVPVLSSGENSKNNGLDYKNELVEFVLEMSEMERLKRLGAKRHVTLNVIMQCVWSILLGRYNDREDVVFGSVVSGRPPELEGIEGMVGLFINAVPVRARYRKEMEFGELLEKLQASALESEMYHYYPLSDIQAGSRLKQHLIDHLFIFENFPVIEQLREVGTMAGESGGGQTLRVFDIEMFEQTNYDFNVVLAGSEQLMIRFEYNGNIFEREFVQRISGHFYHIVRQIIGDETKEIRAIDILTDEEKEKILNELNSTGTHPPGDKTIHELFEKQVVGAPDHIALIGPSMEMRPMHSSPPGKANTSTIKISYRELNGKSNQLARLLKEKGLRRDGLVGMLFERSVEMVIAILAVWKAGGAYIPIDKDNPLERVITVLADSAARIMLASSFSFPDVNRYYEEMCIHTEVEHIIYLDKQAHIQQDNDLFGTFKLSSMLGKSVDIKPSGDQVLHFKNRTLTYCEYMGGVSQLCQFISNRGLHAEFPAAVMLTDPIYKITVLLSLQALNIPFIVIDPQRSGAVKKKIIDDSGVKTVFSQQDFLDELDRWLWESDTFKNYIILDPYDFKQNTKVAGVKEIWNYVAEESSEAVNDYGWSNSYTDEPFSIEEMEEYTRNFKVKLEPFLTPGSKVLEIGCGHGLVLFEIAPRVARYYATDLSEVIIEKNRKRLEKMGLHNVSLRAAAASEIDNLDENGFDIVICSSVVHYFPNSLYLEKVIKSAVDMLTDQGIIYLDDLMDLGKKDELVRSTLEFKKSNPDARVKTEWDGDQFVSEAFFHDLREKYSEIVHWESSSKLGVIENELTRFRYDVILKIDKGVKAAKPGICWKNRYTPEDIEKYAPLPAPLPPGLAFEVETGDGTAANSPPARQFIGDVTDLSTIETYSTLALEQTNQTADLSYVIYTSGSTGRPKGAMVEHGGMMNHIQAKINDLGLKDTAVVAQNASHTFDISVWQFFAAILVRGKTVIFPDEIILEPVIFLEHMVKSGITILEVVPSYLFVLLEHQKENRLIPLPLEYLLVTGEEIKPGLAKKWFDHYPHIKMVNAYGPTEASDDITHHIIDGVPRVDRIPIGKPVHNLNIYIVDSDMRLCPPGIKGEICVSGVGVGRGYLNDLARTSRVFTEDPFIMLAGVRLYKTGDIGRWLPDGVIEFFGRKDRQVKIRGYRIELGEIQNQLLKQDNIKDAVVITAGKDGEEKYLCAYVVTGEEIDIPAIKENLSEVLPDYMIPAYFINIEKIPLTPNGKVDIKALPVPGLKGDEDYIGPGDRIEEILVKIWTEILGIQTTIGINQNFFQLGGHSLKATLMVSKIHRTLDIKVPLAEIFKTPTIRGLADYIRGTVQDRYFTIEPSEEREYYPMSSAQKRLYIIQQVTVDSIAYNMPMLFPLEEKPDIEKIEETFIRLIRRHESLRTSFFTVQDEPRQRIHSIEELEFNVRLFPSYTGQEWVQPFDLSKAPLLRVMAAPYRAGSYILMVDMHHIVSDGVSHTILHRDFISLSGGETLSPLRLQYKDYALWQIDESRRDTVKKQEAYWLKEFQGEIPALNLPIDYPRPLVQSFEGDSVQFVLGIEETGALEKLVLKEGVTMFMVLLGVYEVLLSKLANQEDIVVGTPTAGRRHADLEKIIGMFVNTLALRGFPAGEKTFLEFLKETRERTLEAFENQEYQFEDLVESVEVNRDVGRNPLFDAAFALQHLDMSPTESTKNEVPEIVRSLNDPDIYENVSRVSKFDMVLIAMEEGSTVGVIFQYCTKLFKKETVERFCRYFKAIISAVIKYPGIKLGEIEIVPEDEKKQLLFEFNGSAEYPKDKTIHELFERQVELTPDHIALVVRDESSFLVSVTYKELNRGADRMAGVLVEKGVLPRSLVGIMVERSVEMPVGILGILKSGSAYVPLNPKAPASRTDFMLEECGTSTLLTTPSLSEKITHGKDIVYIENHGRHDGTFIAPGIGQPAANFAYVIFTSGSTGRPKGVPVTHSNLSPLLHWGYDRLGLSPSDRSLQNLSYYFDWSVWEIFITLTSGGSLWLMPDEILMDPENCISFIDKHEITVLHATPTQYRYLARVNRATDSLRYLFLGAEILPCDLVGRSFRLVGRDCRVFNMYGPTEATIISAVLEIDRNRFKDFRDLLSVPIGRGVGNGPLLVLDRYLKVCPVNIGGELYIAGDGVARGYLNDPVKTRGVFVKNIYKAEGIKGRCLYKTGDTVRRLPDGNIEFFGRIDHQVKIRGHRIELGEIENQLLMQENVKEAVVTARENEAGEQYLCAYIVPVHSDEFEEIPLFFARLKEFLSQSLPDYMIPPYFLPIEEIPLTPNGKIDRKALPHPGSGTGKECTAPRDKLEKKLAAIWSDVLDLRGDSLPASGDTADTAVGIDDDFFELGGHSLKATTLTAKIYKELNIKVPLSEVFVAPTIRRLGEYIKTIQTGKYYSIEPVEKKEYYPLSSAQKRLYILQRIELQSIAYNIPGLIPLPVEYDVGKIEGICKKLIHRHESFRTSFRLINDVPVQVVHEEVEIEIEYHDAAQAEIRDITKNFVRAFDLSQPPLLRLGLVKKLDESHVLLVDMHHIISDGVSLGIVIEDFMALYDGEELPALRIQYKDFSQWRNSEREQEKIKRQEEYWLRNFGGDLPVLELPIDYPRPPLQSFEGDTLEFRLSVEQVRALKTIGLGQGATMFMVLTAIFYILLSRLSTREDIIIGTDIAGREHADLDKVIGMFVNTLPLRNFPVGKITFKEFLQQVKKQTLDAFDNQDYPFEDLVEKVSVTRDPSRNPIFDVMFSFTRSDSGSVEVPDPGKNRGELALEIRPDAAVFDLTLSAVESGEHLFFTLEYCTKLFKKESIEQFIGYFKEIVSAVIADKDVKLKDIPVTHRLVAIKSNVHRDEMNDFGF